jgi:hypothetical protein
VVCFLASFSQVMQNKPEFTSAAKCTLKPSEVVQGMVKCDNTELFSIQMSCTAAKLRVKALVVPTPLL